MLKARTWPFGMTGAAAGAGPWLPPWPERGGGHDRGHRGDCDGCQRQRGTATARSRGDGGGGLLRGLRRLCNPGRGTARGGRGGPGAVAHQPGRRDRQVRRHREPRHGEQPAAGRERGGLRGAEPGAYGGDPGGDQGIGARGEAVVVEVAEPQRPARRVRADPPAAQHRPQDERHDLVRVAGQGLQQPAGERGDGGGSQCHARVVVAGHDQGRGERQPGPGDEEARRGGDERQVQAALAAPVPDVGGQRGQVRGQPGGEDGGPGPGERLYADQQPGRQQRHPGGDQPYREPPGPVTAGHVGQEEHRPQLFRHRDVGEPQPGEQADDRMGEHDMAGQVEPVPAPVGHIGDAEACRRHEAGQREPQASDRVALAPRGQRGGQVHRQQRHRDRGQGAPGLHHAFLLRGEPGREQPGGAQPGRERGPGQGDRPQWAMRHHRRELVQRAGHPHRQGRQHADVGRRDHRVSGRIGHRGPARPDQGGTAGCQPEGGGRQEAERHPGRRHHGRHPRGPARPGPGPRRHGRPRGCPRRCCHRPSHLRRRAAVERPHTHDAQNKSSRP